MNQRSDLLAFSLFLVSVLLTIFIGLMPITVDGIWRWQTLIGGAIGGTITGLGLFVATTNVTRQLRVAARAREQDRLERELPGLRAAAFLLGGISIALGKDASGTNVIAELGLQGFDKNKIGEFVPQVLDALPLTPDATKRDLALELFKLRAKAVRVVEKEWIYNASRNHLTRTPAMHQDRPKAEAAIAAAQAELEIVEKQLKDAVAEFETYREALIAFGKSELSKQQILRREHEKYLAISP